MTNPTYEIVFVACARCGEPESAEAIRDLAKDGQGELFPETEPVFCIGCQDVLADEYEAEFGWMRSF